MAAAQARRVRRVLHAEWTKLRTTAGPASLALAVVGLTVGVSVLTAATIHVDTRSSQDPVRLGLTGIDVGQAAVAGLGVMVIAGEYATDMIHTTLLAMPHRLTVLAGKALLVSAVALVAGVLAVLGCLLFARLLLPGAGLTPAHGYSLVSLTDPTTVRAAAGAVLYLVLIGLLGLGVATVVRDAATATGLVLGLLYLFPILGSAISDPTWHRHLEQIGPMTAGQAIFATTNLAGMPLSPWAGLGVLAAWAAGALLLGGVLLRVRDA
jgi:ABC-2 type transport system permease protein